MMAMATLVPTASASPDAIACLLAAYPDFLKDAPNGNSIRSHQNELFEFDAALPAGTHQWQLSHADLKTQFSQPYPREPLTQAPALNSDPGRLRSAIFFERMYGQSLTQVQKHLTTIDWAPCQCKIQFTHRNGAAKALERIGRELARRPELLAYVNQPLGALNWRNIQGTNRRSMHAYGAAIDFRMPQSLHHYWQWRGCKPGGPCAYPAAVFSDVRLQEVVKKFEEHGFIWGGKWYHFDTVHFEFRPELTGAACRQ